MKSWIRFLSPARNIDSLIASAAGFYIIYLLTQHGGIGISPDSVTYLSTARNFNAGNGLIQFDQTPLVDFPSFYPIFLSAVMSVTQLDPLLFAPLLNGLLFTILIYLSGSLMNGFSFRSKWYKRILLSCIVLGPCLLEVYSMLWSETLFLVLILLYIIAIKNYFQTYSIGSLLGLSFITALACVTRYAGVTLIVTGGLLFLLNTYLQPGKKIFHIFIFGIISSSLLVLNLARNTMLGSTLTGMREKGVTLLNQNIYFYGNVLCDWLPVVKSNYVFAFVTGLLYIVVFAVIFIRRVTGAFRLFSCESIVTLFSLVYSLFIILSSTLLRYEQINSRLLSPIFIPFLWCLSYWLPPFIDRLSLLKRGWTIALCILVIIGFQYNQLSINYETYDGVKDAGIPGYTEDTWKESPTIDFIRKNPKIFDTAKVYSNANDAVYFFTGKQCDLLPHKDFQRQVQAFFNQDKFCVIWFNDGENPDLVSLQNIQQHKKIVSIKQFTDGAIYADSAALSSVDNKILSK